MPSINTYHNASEEHVLDKSITLIEENVGVELKENTNIMNPIIILSRLRGINFNYVYLDVFDRFYYVKNITYSQQRYYIDLEVDVLMSFKDRIGELEVIANRSSSYYNTYQKDDSLPFENRSIISTQPFASGFGGECLILAVNGGGLAPEQGGDE